MLCGKSTTVLIEGNHTLTSTVVRVKSVYNVVEGSGRPCGEVQPIMVAEDCSLSLSIEGIWTEF